MPLHYVGIRVTDLDRSVRFYTRTLGLRVKIRGQDRRGGRGVWVGLEDPVSHAKLELNWYPAGSSFATDYAAGESLDHIGFSLGRVSRRELEREYARLLEAGAKPTAMTPARTEGWMACVADPDGIWIEIFRWPTPAERRKTRPRRNDLSRST